MELDQATIVVGGRYRARQPVVVRTQFRDVWDDRTVTWIGPGRRALEYTFALGTQTSKASAQIGDFLKWAGRELGPEEGSDVKK